MTPRRAVERVAAVLPATLAPFVRTHGRCILATRLAILALERLGVAAHALPVHVDLYNGAAVQWMLEHAPGGVDEFARRGCYHLTTRAVPPGAQERPATREYLGRKWRGHLAAHIPALQLLVDADARALARPEFQLHVPDALILPWDGQRCEMAGPEGARLLYRALRHPLTGQPDQTFLQSPDWNEPIEPLLARVLRAARR